MKKSLISFQLIVVVVFSVLGLAELFGGVECLPVRIIGALDWEERGGAAEVVAGPWKQCGEVITPDQPFECEDSYTIDPEFIKLPCEEGAPWFYSVNTTVGEGKYNLVLMDENGKHLLSRDGSGVFTLEGLPDDMYTVQPQVFKLSEGSYRMYFWSMGPGKIRMMVAESSDLYHWKLANNSRPVLCHPADQTRGEGLSASRVCNDATTIYRYPDGSWEIFSATVIRVTDDNSRYADRNVCPGGRVRVVMRWTSLDGLNFSDPEVVLTPDEQDSPATQCYYLSRVDLEPYTVGFFGNYNAQDLLWRMEAVVSRDHRHWSRPIRNHGLFEDECKGVVAITDFGLEADGNVSLYYGAVNFDHDYKTDNGEPPVAKVCKAQVPRRKFFGRHLEQGVTLVSPIIRYTGKNPKIYVSEGAQLTCEWQDLFATTRRSVAIEVRGDIAEVKLSSLFSPPETGYLHITGTGIVYDAEY